MIKQISQLIFLSSLLVWVVLASSPEAPTVLTSVVHNDTMLRWLLRHIDKNVKLRRLSKTFRRLFDEVCTEQLLLLDPRVKSLIQDEEGKIILSPLGTSLPQSVLIIKLYTSYLNRVYPLHRESFDDKFPVLQVPEDETADVIINMIKEQSIIDSKRFVEMLRTLMRDEYSIIFLHKIPPIKLFSLFVLLMATFSERHFKKDLIKSIKFPFGKLKEYAASGKLPSPYGVEILSRFSINSEPHLIFDAIGSGIPDILRTIFKNSQNDISILEKQKSAEYRTPMHKAAVQGNVEIINLLLDLEFSVDVKGRGGVRPIHLACMCGNYGAVVRLFKFDNEVTSSPLKDSDRPAPIVEAALNGHIRIVKFFLTQTSINLTKNRLTSRRLAEVALLRKDAKLGNLLLKYRKVKLTVAEIKKLRSLK